MGRATRLLFRCCRHRPDIEEPAHVDHIDPDRYEFHFISIGALVTRLVGDASFDQRHSAKPVNFGKPTDQNTSSTQACINPVPGDKPSR